MISKLIFKYCSEDPSLVENYEKAFNSNEKWECHHRLEIQENKTYSKKELISMNLYWNRPAVELIFMTKKEHIRLHNFNRKHSEETRKKISQSRKNLLLIESTRSEEFKKKMSELNSGKNNPMYGKKRPDISEKNKLRKGMKYNKRVHNKNN